MVNTAVFVFLELAFEERIFVGLLLLGEHLLLKHVLGFLLLPSFSTVTFYLLLCARSRLSGFIDHFRFAFSIRVLTV